tara:strand:+ start:93 stop:422 length:330 start_codon:yes stop_codon:yes gene_type:complete
MSERKRKLEPAKPNLVDDYADLVDALKDKYKMTEGDWKTLLDSGMALYKYSPDRPSYRPPGWSGTSEERFQHFRALREDMRRHADAYLDSLSRMAEAHAPAQARPQDRS